MPDCRDRRTRLPVLFVGDINVDIIMGGLESQPVVDREITCSSFDITVGSPSVIAACAYTSLGGAAAFCGLAGADEYGDSLLHEMQSYGIQTDLVRRSNHTKTGVTVSLVHGNSRTQVTYPGSISAFDGSWVDERALAPYRHVHLAGVYLQERFRPRITGVLRAARALHCTTSLDPQWDSTEKWELMDEWLPMLTYLFLNKDEATSITGCGSTEAAVRTLAERTRCPVVKEGGNGASVWITDGPVHIPAPAVNVIDTTGAGDSFDAAFLFGTLQEEMDEKRACELAVAVGTRCCLFAGGVAARTTYGEARRFMCTQGAGHGEQTTTSGRDR